MQRTMTSATCPPPAAAACSTSGGRPCRTARLQAPDVQSRLLLGGVGGHSALGAFAFAGIALNRNEPVSAAWLVTARSASISSPTGSTASSSPTGSCSWTIRATPAERHNDGLDYVPTNKYVVFGHHFAAIAGAGPLVGPVLAAQMGYLPGTLWILVGVVFAGAVQDFIILFCSIRATAARSAKW